MSWIRKKPVIQESSPVTASIVKQMEDVPPVKPLPQTSKLLGDKYKEIPEVKKQVVEDEMISDYEAELMRRDEERLQKIKEARDARLKPAVEPEPEVEEDVDEFYEDQVEQPKPKIKPKVEKKLAWEIVTLPTAKTMEVVDGELKEVVTSSVRVIKNNKTNEILDMQQALVELLNRTEG